MSNDTINMTALVAVASVLVVPIYHKFIKPKFKTQDVDTKKDDDAGGRRGRLSRRPSVLEELTSVPLVLRAMLWLQTFNGLVAWLAPKMNMEMYGVTDISPLAAMIGEDLGRVWVAIHFGALIGGRKGVSAATVISSGLALLLLSELKALLNDEYLGANTPNRVIVLILIKLISLWGLEYGPDISTQEGLLAETLSKVIPSQEHIGQFVALYVTLDGSVMYFAPYKYAEFWGYTIDDELVRLCTVFTGYTFIMLGVFWFALLRDVGAWKAFGLAAIVYWGCNFDIAFLSKTAETTETGVLVDLTLSYITIITAEPWDVFM